MCWESLLFFLFFSFFPRSVCCTINRFYRIGSSVSYLSYMNSPTSLKIRASKFSTCLVKVFRVIFQRLIQWVNSRCETETLIFTWLNSGNATIKSFLLAKKARSVSFLLLYCPMHGLEQEKHQLAYFGAVRSLKCRKWCLPNPVGFTFLSNTVFKVFSHQNDHCESGLYLCCFYLWFWWALFLQFLRYVLIICNEIYMFCLLGV